LSLPAIFGVYSTLVVTAPAWGFEPWYLQHLAFTAPAKLDIGVCLLKDSSRDDRK
jgi:hypothetical protein